jgi:hypothetical protein
MATNELQVALHVTLDEMLRSYFMQRRRSLLTELDDIEKLLCISPRTSEIRKANKPQNPPPQYECERKFIEQDKD